MFEDVVVAVISGVGPDMAPLTPAGPTTGQKPPPQDCPEATQGPGLLAPLRSQRCV